MEIASLLFMFASLACAFSSLRFERLSKPKTARVSFTIAYALIFLAWLIAKVALDLTKKYGG